MRLAEADRKNGEIYGRLSGREDDLGAPPSVVMAWGGEKTERAFHRLRSNNFNYVNYVACCVEHSGDQHFFARVLLGFDLVIEEVS